MPSPSEGPAGVGSPAAPLSKRGTKRAPPPARATPPQPVPTAATPAGTGYLRALADPYALVKINGAIVGPTPLMHQPVPAGRVVVELIEPDDGAVRATHTVLVAPDALVTVSALP